MTRMEAVKTAVGKVEDSGFTFVILRRGKQYQSQMAAIEPARGWKVVDMIGPGNVQNFKNAA